MPPSKPSFFKFSNHSHNRSQPSLLNPPEQQTQPSPVSPLPSPAPSQQVFPERVDSIDGRFSPNHSQIRDGEQVEAAPIGQSLPTRSRSKKFVGVNVPSGPTINLVGGPGGSGAAETGFDNDLHHQHQQYDPTNSNENPQLLEPPAKSSRRRGFFGAFGHSSSQRENSHPNPGVPTVKPPHSDQGNLGGLSRKISLRRPKESISTSRYSAHSSPIDPQQPQGNNFHSAENSTTHLPPSSEEEEDSGLDPFLIQPERGSAQNGPQGGRARPVTLQPPPKDINRVPLQRVPTDPYQQQLQQSQHDLPPPPRQGSFGHAQYQPDPRQQNPPTYQAYQPSNTSDSTSNLSQSSHQFDQSGHAVYANQPQTQQDQQNYPPPPPPPPHQQQYQGYEPQAQTQPAQSSQGIAPASQNSMPPPPGQPPSRRSIDMSQKPQPNLPRDVSAMSTYGQPGHGQGQGQQATANASQFSSQPPGSQGQNYRGGPPQQQHPGQPNVGEHGRSTPPLPRAGNDDDLNIARLLQEHETLQTKYKKVKTLYFERIAQVEQLQNTLAHQRLAQSRTSLDDNEYAQRFNRLDGAINNLAFNIRKDWKAIPSWLQPVVNQDAHLKVTKEMTVVGRAWISSWIVDEIIDRHFHPCLEPMLSTQLKIIEKNIRKLAPPQLTNEEDDALLAKVSNWRLTTLDALRETIEGPKGAECRHRLTDNLVEKLTASLAMHLKEPTPPGLEGGVRMIIELSIGIAANLPLESREVYVEYFMPGTPVIQDYMKIETTLPPLTNPGTGSDFVEADQTSLGSTEASSAENASAKDQPSSSQADSAVENGAKDGAKKKTGMFGSLINNSKKSSQQPDNLQTQMKQAGSTVSLNTQQQPPGSSAGSEGQKVRVAGFMAVEVRGRSILCKAPVWVQ